MNNNNRKKANRREIAHFIKFIPMFALFITFCVFRTNKVFKSIANEEYRESIESERKSNNKRK